MKTTDQIAAEAADRILFHLEERRKFLSETDPITYKGVLSDIIKAAIKKAERIGYMRGEN